MPCLPGNHRRGCPCGGPGRVAHPGAEDPRGDPGHEGGPVKTRRLEVRGPSHAPVPRRHHPRPRPPAGGDRRSGRPAPQPYIRTARGPLLPPAGAPPERVARDRHGRPGARGLPPAQRGRGRHHRPALRGGRGPRDHHGRGLYQEPHRRPGPCYGVQLQPPDLLRRGYPLQGELRPEERSLPAAATCGGEHQ